MHIKGNVFNNSHNDLVNKIISKREAMTRLSRSVDKRCDMYRHIAMVTAKNGRVLGTGANGFIPSIKFGYTEHAEISALRHAKRNLQVLGKLSSNKKVTVDLTVLRTTLVNSQPCIHCINSILGNDNFNVRRVYFSNGDGIDCKSLNAIIDNPDSLCITKNNRPNHYYLDCDDDEEEDDDEEKRK